jgi:hypothetical protein
MKIRWRLREFLATSNPMVPRQIQESVSQIKTRESEQHRMIDPCEKHRLRSCVFRKMLQQGYTCAVFSPINSYRLIIDVDLKDYSLGYPLLIA